MGWSLLWLLGGLALLVIGGEGLVRGSVALARRLGVPSLVIGLTIVAFGTSTPELVVNLTAAWRGASEIGFGNVVGSNIANITLLLGITALIRPLAVSQTVVIREIPMMLLTATAVTLMALDGPLTARPADDFDRIDGLILLLLFAVFLYYLLAEALRARQNGVEMPATPMGWWAAAGLILAGLLGLILGGHATVTGAVGLARAAGMPEVVIGLTIVAVGTSLPELATSIAAARHNQADLAIGNLVGSNIYNITFIFGFAAAIDPIPLPAGGLVDLAVMLFVSLALLPLAVSQKRISRVEGVVLLACYAAYMVWMVVR